MTLRTVFWGSLRRGEIGAAARAGALPLLPIGATEQHGPHLPVNTDINAALTVCVRAAESLNGAALVLPPVAWGVSPYWMGFAGTITLRPETLLALVADIAASVAHHGFRGLLLVNGHGGHAGQAETSIALYLQANHVDRGSLESDLPGVDLPKARHAFADGHGVYEPPWPEQDSPQAVFGHPPGATAHKGQNIIEAAASGLADLVSEFRATLPLEANGVAP